MSNSVPEDYADACIETAVLGSSQPRIVAPVKDVLRIFDNRASFGYVLRKLMPRRVPGRARSRQGPSALGTLERTGEAAKHLCIGRGQGHTDLGTPLHMSRAGSIYDTY